MLLLPQEITSIIDRVLKSFCFLGNHKHVSQNSLGIYKEGKEGGGGDRGEAGEADKRVRE